MGEGWAAEPRCARLLACIPFFVVLWTPPLTLAAEPTPLYPKGVFTAADDNSTQRKNDKGIVRLS